VENVPSAPPTGTLAVTRDTCEGSKKLDAAEFARHGWLRPGLSGSSSWTCRGEPSGRIGWRSEHDQLILAYTVTDWRGEKHEYDYPVRVERTPAGFGGVRTWWRCPSTRCGRLVKVLYLPGSGRYFLCRRCHDLAYHSQNDRHAGYWKLVEREHELERAAYDPTVPVPQRTAALRDLDQLHQFDREPPPLRGLLARLEAAELREAAKAELPPRGPGRPSKQALRERTRAAKQAAAVDPMVVQMARLGLNMPVAPPRPPGRPKEKRAYTRRVPFTLETPPAPDRAYCPRCRDRRPLTYRRVVKLSNQRHAIQGRCTECGTVSRRLLKVRSATERSVGGAS